MGLLRVMVASFACTLGFVYWFWLSHSCLAFVYRLALTSGRLAFSRRFGLADSLIFTNMLGVFDMLAVVCMMPGFTFTKMLGRVYVCVATIVRSYCSRCDIATTKLIGRCAC